MLFNESVRELCEWGGAVPRLEGAACRGSSRCKLLGTGMVPRAGSRKVLLVLCGLQSLIFQKASLTP